VFRRRRRDDEPENDLEPTDEETVADEEIEDDDEPAVVAHGGPWDSEADSVPEMERVDFGAVQVPIGEGLEIQVNVEAVEQDAEGNPVGGRIVAITIVHGESGLQVQPFAAPKKNGIWEEVRKETADEIKQAEGETQEAEGPFGTELHGMVPVAIPEEMRDQVPADIAEQGFGWQPVRFIGVDGPRWFLRGVLSGRAAIDEGAASPLVEVFKAAVVVRGTEPMAPRELLPLALPRDAEAAAAAETAALDAEDEAERTSLDPFQRGPEITEVR
jgi:hypothetical protein